MSNNNGIIGKRGNHDRMRTFPGVRGRAPHGARLRREGAIERLTYWNSLTIKEQLEQLDRKLGKGVGAKKQRARLASCLERSKNGGATSTNAQLQPSEGEVHRKMKAKERREAERARNG